MRMDLDDRMRMGWGWDEQWDEDEMRMRWGWDEDEMRKGWGWGWGWDEDEDEEGWDEDEMRMGWKMRWGWDEDGMRIRDEDGMRMGWGWDEDGMRMGWWWWDAGVPSCDPNWTAIVSRPMIRFIDACHENQWSVKLPGRRLERNRNIWIKPDLGFQRYTLVTERVQTRSCLIILKFDSFNDAWYSAFDGIVINGLSRTRSKFGQAIIIRSQNISDAAQVGFGWCVHVWCSSLVFKFGVQVYILLRCIQVCLLLFRDNNFL